MEILIHSFEDARHEPLPYFDVYARPEYGRSAELIDLGTWRCASTSDSSISFSFIERQIPGTPYSDIITPYGYGALSCADGVSETSKREFRRSFLSQAKARGIVSEFLRLSPLDNHDALLEGTDKAFERSTFGGTIESHSSYFASVDTKHRTSVRKAVKNGVAVMEEDPAVLIDPECNFRKLYDATMERLEARDSLRFATAYYARLLELPPDSLRVLTATLDSIPIAATLFIIGDGRLHYHLSGATQVGRTTCATNLLIDHAVASDARSTFTLHLGGGLTEGDTLERFKRRATPSRYTMHYAQTRINPEIYDALSAPHPATDYFPAYRAGQG